MGRNDRQVAAFIFKSKTVKVYKPTDGQLTAFSTIAAAKTPAAMSRAASQFFRILEALIVDADNWAWMEDQLLDGTSDILDYVEFMQEVVTNDWAQDGDE